MANSFLQVASLTKKYGKRTVVNNLSLEMTSGQIVGLLGPNGAGKTTMFYMIVGFIASNGGSIYLNNQDITKLPMYKRSSLGLSYLPQEPSIFRKLSVEDNINLILETRCDLTKREQKAERERLLVEFGLSTIRKQKGYTLSGGERRRTEIARSIATKPKFLLLDEPFAGIDPKAVYEIKQLIKNLSNQNIGILLTDHNVRDTLSIVHLAHIINNGQLLASGNKSELLENEDARHIYFGEDFL